VEQAGGLEGEVDRRRSDKVGEMFAKQLLCAYSEPRLLIR